MADKEKARESKKGATPYTAAVDVGSLIQIMMEVQKTTGELSVKMDTLTKSVEDLHENTSKRIRPLERFLWGVAGAVVVLSIIGWLLSPLLSALAQKILS